MPAPKRRGRPSGLHKPEKIKANFRLLPDDYAYIRQLTEEHSRLDPYGASPSQTIHELIKCYRQHNKPQDAASGGKRFALAAGTPAA